MHDIEDIPHLPDQATRLAEITVDAYGRDEELSSFEVYLLFPPGSHPALVSESPLSFRRSCSYRWSV